jgi:hypothetical protein
MNRLILSIYILLFLVESSSRSPENPLAKIVGIWNGEKFNKGRGRFETTQYKAVVKDADTYKVVWWPKDPADRRVGMANLKIDSEGNMIKEWEDNYGVKQCWVCDKAFELLTGQHDLEWRFASDGKVGKVVETWTSCYEEPSALPEYLNWKLSKQNILEEVLRKLAEHNQKVIKMKHDGSILRPRKPFLPASKAQATTISGLMPHACVGNGNQSGYVIKEENFPSLGQPAKASSSKHVHTGQKASRLLSEVSALDTKEAFESDIPESVSSEQLTRVDSFMDTTRIADVCSLPPQSPPNSPLPHVPAYPPPPPPRKPERIDALFEVGEIFERIDALHESDEIPPPPPQSLRNSHLPPFSTSRPCPPPPRKPKRIEAPWDLEKFLKEEEEKQQSWKGYKSERGLVWYFNEGENTWFYKVHHVNPVADPKNQGYEVVDLNNGPTIWWNPETEGVFNPTESS